MDNLYFHHATYAAYSMNKWITECSQNHLNVADDFLWSSSFPASWVCFPHRFDQSHLHHYLATKYTWYTNLDLKYVSNIDCACKDMNEYSDSIWIVKPVLIKLQRVHSFTPQWENCHRVEEVAAIKLVSHYPCTRPCGKSLFCSAF